VFYVYNYHHEGDQEMIKRIVCLIGEREYSTWDIPNETKTSDHLAISIHSDVTNQTLLMNFEFIMEQEGEKEGDIDMIYGMTSAFSPKETHVDFIKKLPTTKG
jgi:hypothetical protein